MRGAARLLRWLWSAAWLAVLMAGVPVVLVAWVGWPLPERWPDRHRLADWVAQPLTGSAVAGTIAVAAWLVWAVLVYALLAGLLGRLRRRPRWLPRLPLPGPVQAVTGGLFGVAVVGAGAAPVLAPSAPHDAFVSTVDGGVGVAAPVNEVRAPAAAATPAPGADDPRPAGPVGVGLPDGGWLPDSVAAATSSAAALVWWRRRRAYVPGPPHGPVRDDADLAPLPPTVAAVQAARLLPADDDGDLPEDTTGGGADRTRAGGGRDGAGAAGVIGHWADRPLHAWDLPPGGVGLTGPGAGGAARGVLAALLVTAPPDRGAPDRVVTTAADLGVLLGAAAAAQEGVPGLRVVDGLAEALTVLEHVLLNRGHTPPTPADRRSTVAVDGHAVAVDGAGVPVVLVATVPADPDLARRLAVLLTLGHRHGVAGVLVGAWPAGATWQVDADGVTHPADLPAVVGPRLCTLTGGAATDLLTLFRDVTGPAPQPAPSPRRPQAGPAPTKPRPPRPVRGAATDPACDSSGAPVRLRVLGGVDISCHGVPLPVRRSAAMQILVLLAVHRDGATSQRLTQAICPQLRPHVAAGRTYTSISELRKGLRAATGGVDVVVRVQERYLLDPAHVEVDLWRLHDAVARAATALLPDERHTALRAVIGHYAGELAAGQHWHWVAAPREATRRHAIDAYATLAADEPQQAVALLQDALRIDPVNEALHRQAVRAVAATGDRAAVTALPERHTRDLAEAGLPPDPATPRLAADNHAEPPDGAASR